MSQLQPTVPTNTASLASLAPDSWFKERSKSTLWLRICTYVGMPFNELIASFNEAVTGWNTTAAFLDPIALAIGSSDLSVSWYGPISLYTNPDGELQILQPVEFKPLPSANYIFLLTPCSVDGAEGGEPIAKRRLNRFSALVCSLVGLNFIRHVVSEFEMSADGGQLTTPGPVLRVPRACEGPFLHREHFEAMSEITIALRSARASQRQRIELALEYLDRGIRELDGFFFYWTALEVLIGGTAPKIRDRLQKCYGLKRPQDADSELAFGIITSWRHDLIHHGVRPQLTADVDRYIQLMFIDLVRHELGLAQRYYLSAILQAPGYNLSSIGLADNRTDEQRQGPHPREST